MRGSVPIAWLRCIAPPPVSMKASVMPCSTSLLGDPLGKLDLRHPFQPFQIAVRRMASSSPTVGLRPSSFRIFAVDGTYRPGFQPASGLPQHFEAAVAKQSRDALGELGDRNALFRTNIVDGVRPWREAKLPTARRSDRPRKDRSERRFRRSGRPPCGPPSRRG